MNISSDLQRTQPAPETFSPSTPESIPEKALQVQPAVAEQVTDEAHVSPAASIIVQSVSEAGVNTDKVAAVQAALASGTYHVSSSQVAGKLIDHMLGNGS